MAELFVNKPNPLYEANYLATERIVINQGGTYCFAPDTLVFTQRGNIPIRDVKAGELVKTLDESSGLPRWNKVLETMEYANTKATIRIKMKDGSILEATEDHEIFFEGGWKTLKEIVSLHDERSMENNT